MDTQSIRILLQEINDKTVQRLQQLITEKQDVLLQDIAEQHAGLRADFSQLRSIVATQLEIQRMSSDARADDLAAQIAALHTVTASTTSSQLLSVVLSPAAGDRGQPEPDGVGAAWAQEPPFPQDYNAQQSAERWAVAAAADAAAYAAAAATAAAKTAAAAAAAAAPTAPMLPETEQEQQLLSTLADAQEPREATSKTSSRKRLMRELHGHNPFMCLLCHRSFKEVRYNKEHMQKCWDATSNCQFIEGFDAHEAILQTIAKGTPKTKWLKAVSAWTQQKPAHQ